MILVFLSVLLISLRNIFYIISLFRMFFNDWQINRFLIIIILVFNILICSSEWFLLWLEFIYIFGWIGLLIKFFFRFFPNLHFLCISYLAIVFKKICFFVSFSVLAIVSVFIILRLLLIFPICYGLVIDSIVDMILMVNIFSDYFLLYSVFYCFFSDDIFTSCALWYFDSLILLTIVLWSIIEIDIIMVFTGLIGELFGLLLYPPTVFYIVKLIFHDEYVLFLVFVFRVSDLDNICIGIFSFRVYGFLFLYILDIFWLTVT